MVVAVILEVRIDQRSISSAPHRRRHRTTRKRAAALPNLYDAELHISRHAASIPAVQHFFAAVCKELCVSDRTRLQVELALEEGLSNQLKYALAEDTIEYIRVKLEFRHDIIRITARAPGRPYDFTRLPHYEPLCSLDDDAVGLGTFLMDQTMDSVEWRYVEKQGQELVMVKCLPSPVELVQDAVAGTRVPTKGPVGAVTCRTVRDYEDALALSTCAWDIYRYNYKDVVYYPHEVVARNASGQLRSWIAVDEAGTVFGHYAIMRRKVDDVLGEMGAAFVRPESRKDGLFQRLSIHAHADAFHCGLRGLFSLSVTNHVATQKLSEKMGRCTIGLRLASSPSIFVEGAAPGERVTTTLNYCQLTPRDPRAVFLPPRYREILRKSYQWLGIPITEDAPTIAIEEESVDCQRDLTWNRALIEARGGAVARHKMLAFTELLLEQGTACILLSIDLEDPRAGELVEEAAAAGYFYSGLFPESLENRHDALQMQLLNGIRLDPCEIHLHQESAQEIMRWVQAEVPQIFAVEIAR